MDVKSIAHGSMSHWRDLVGRHLAADLSLELVVLKGHLIIEEMLTSMICHYSRAPELVADVGLRFIQKARLVRALLALPIEDSVWETILLINAIRNDYAHGLEPAKLRSHLDAACLRAKGFWSPQDGVPPLNFSDDKEVVSFLVGFCHGSLSLLETIVSVMEKERRG